MRQFYITNGQAVIQAILIIWEAEDRVGKTRTRFEVMLAVESPECKGGAIITDLGELHWTIFRNVLDGLKAEYVVVYPN